MRLRTPVALALAAATAFTGVSSLGVSNAAERTNLVTNRSFEYSTNHWSVTRGAVLDRVWGKDSRYAARVTSTQKQLVVLNDTPDVVSSSVKGATYTASAWLRSPDPGVTVYLQLREWTDAGHVGTKATPITLTTAWQQVSVDYVAKADGNRVALTVVAKDLPAGHRFVTDLLSLNETPPAPPKPAWTAVYSNDFSSMDGVRAFQSPVTVNDTLKPSDISNNMLQKPSLASNVVIQPDAAAQDGKAMAVWTRPATYKTSTGTKVGWTNGRMMIANQDQSPPVRIQTRLRMTPSIGVKAAVMWWPAGGGWPWEVDFAETFGGSTLTDYWGSRQNVTQRWHADLNGDGRAIEQLIHDDKIDATKYHVYDLFITPERMWIEIDGVKTFETTDTRFIPDSPGFFSVGKALTHRRDLATRTQDAVVVDWVKIYKPTP